MTSSTLIFYLYFSYLIIDVNFPYSSYFSIFNYNFDISNPLRTVYGTYFSPKIVIFIRGLTYELDDNYYHNHIFNVQWSINSLSSYDYEVKL